VRLVWAFARRDIAYSSSSKLTWFGQAVSMLLMTSMLYFIGRTFDQTHSPALSAFHGRYFAFALVGLVFARFQSVALRSFASAIRRDQMMGTLEAMLVTRASVPSIVISASTSSFIFTAFQAVLFLIIGALIFRVDLHHANVLTTVVTLILAMLAISPIGILAAASVIAFKQGDSALNMIANATSFLAGVYFPVAVLPWPLRMLSSVLPITHGLSAIRAAMLTGASLSVVRADVVVLAGFAFIGLPIALGTFMLAIQHARRVGSLSHT
jgi:ABC-2 type transport system permease protein